MLREPTKGAKRAQVRKDKQTRRFQIVKLEDRIAPRAHHNNNACDGGNKEKSGHCG